LFLAIYLFLGSLLSESAGGGEEEEGEQVCVFHFVP
jgi:hypothetical protein